MKKYILLTSLFISYAFAQLDSVSNFAQGTLASGISSTATTIILESGHGDRFPISGYNLTLWDFGRYGTNINGAYRASKAEIIRVTARSGDTLTVTRAQEGTTARTFNSYGTTYYVTNTITRKMITDLNTQLLSRDSVDIPLIFPFSEQTLSAQTTVYSGLGYNWSSGSDSAKAKNSFGVNGRIIALYFQGKLNTMTANSTLTLQYADSSSKTFSSALTTTITPNQNFASVTGQSLNVTPYKIGGFKFVNSSGSGSILLGTITLVIRTPIN
jgi:hypothetical protein